MNVETDGHGNGKKLKDQLYLAILTESTLPGTLKNKVGKQKLITQILL